MSFSTLLATPPDELEAYINELASEVGWSGTTLRHSINYVRNTLLRIPNGYSMISSNAVAIHALICLLSEGHIEFEIFDWAFTSEGHPVTSEGYSMFRYEIEERGEHYMLLTQEQVSFLLGYLNDLEEDSSDRNFDYSWYSNMDTETLSILKDYLNSVGIDVTPLLGSVIPPNSDSLLVREDTSRFSSATWYQAIQDKIITLAGVGGIGSYVGFLLARVHPKSMFIYDDDTVEAANMSGQLYSREDIGMPKVDALSRMVSNYANYDSMFAINGRFTEETEASDIMICGFDNMEARKLFFNKWVGHVSALPKEDRKKCLFIDGRLAAEELQVLAFTGDNEWAIHEYELKFLFSDEEADETICSYKQTTYMANLIGSLIVNIFVNFVANEVSGWDERDVPFLTSYDGLTMFFKTNK